MLRFSESSVFFERLANTLGVYSKMRPGNSSNYLGNLAVIRSQQSTEVCMRGNNG